MQESARPWSPADLSRRTADQASAALAGRVHGLARLMPFLGPAFIAAVAYVDPGNFATNIESGARYGYRLLWVVVAASLMAILFQALSSKLGIATGKNLAEHCRDAFWRPLVVAMWGVSEVAAMATDLAEFLGASLALNLLFHIPLLYATGVTGIATCAVLALERYGFRPLELVIGALVGVIAVCYLAETLLAAPDAAQVAYHAVVPWLGGPRSLLLAAGIVGATVMPHVVYLHSGLTQGRVVPATPAEAKALCRYNRVDVGVAMGTAGLINLAMLYMAAAVFHAHGHPQVAGLATAYQTLRPLLGGAAAAVFLVSLLASGLSSSSVGTLAGQLVMQGFVGFAIPVWVRRAVTMVPTVVIVALGLNPTQTLVLSQVVLSLALPVPLVALVKLTNRRDVMRSLVNGRGVAALAIACTVAIVLLNAALLWQLAGGGGPKGL